MDGKNIAESPKMGYVKPVVQETDCKPHTNTTVVMAINEFNVRLATMRSKNPGWNDRRNQRRPFKDSFVNFVKELVARLPVVPDIYPTREGNILLKYIKTRPRDVWQTMEILIMPKRSCVMTVKSRVPKQEPFTMANTARADILSEHIRRFYQVDNPNTKNHPVRYRQATISDIPAISMMVQSHLGIFERFSSRKIASQMEFCWVAEDPHYGIISVAALGKDEASGDVSNFIYDVNFIITLEPLRGLGIGGTCLRKAVNACLQATNREVEIIAAVKMPHDETVDDCKGILQRSGFHRVKIVKNEGRYREFACAYCNLDQCLCDISMAMANCSTVYYKLGDKGGTSNGN